MTDYMIRAEGQPSPFKSIIVDRECARSSEIVCGILKVCQCVLLVSVYAWPFLPNFLVQALADEPGLATVHAKIPRHVYACRECIRTRLICLA